MARTKKPARQHCEWREDDDGVWQTVCGHSFYFDDAGTPREHGLRFCGHWALFR